MQSWFRARRMGAVAIVVGLAAATGFLLWPSAVDLGDAAGFDRHDPDPKGNGSLTTGGPAQPTTGLERQAAGSGRPVPGQGGEGVGARGVRIEGIVLAAEDGRPLAGAHVELQGWPRSDAAVAAYRKRLQWTDPEAVTTGADGRFALAVEPLPPLGWDLRVQAPGRASHHRRWHELKGDQQIDPIRLPRAFPVRAVAVTADGRPAAGAVLSLAQSVPPARPGGALGRLIATSDAGGNLDFPAVAAGEHGVVAELESRWRMVGRPKLTVGHDGKVMGARILVAELAARIVGRVVDDGGQALVHVDLAAKTGQADLGRARTDDRGRFVLCRHRDLEMDEPLRLVTANGIVLTPAPQWNAPPRDYVAARPGAIDLLVVDRAQRPVERFSVRWLGGGRPDRVGSLGGHHRHGRVHLGECPAGKTWFDVLPGGDEAGRAGVVEVDVPPGSTQSVTVQLAPPVRRVVRVTDADGRPVPSAAVHVIVVPPGVGPDVAAEPDANWRRVHDGVDRRPWILERLQSDGEGKAEVLLPIGFEQYEVAVAHPGLAPAIVAHTLDPAVGRAVIDVVLGRGTVVRGTVVPADFARVFARARISEQPLAVRVSPVTPEGSRKPRPDQSVAIAGDGTFLVRGLSPGRYHVDLGHDGWDVFRTGAMLAVSGDAEVEFVLDLSRFLPGSLAGRLLLDGAPARGVKVHVHSRQSLWRTPAQTTDEEGRFTFEPVLPGPTWVRLADAIDPEPIEVRPGQRSERAFTIGGHRVRVRVLGADGQPVRSMPLYLALLPERVPLRPFVTDDDGCATLDRLPAGTLLVVEGGVRTAEATFAVPSEPGAGVCEVMLRRVAEPAAPPR